jgi:hypothetical protein
MKFKKNVLEYKNQWRANQELGGVAIKHLAFATSTFLTDSVLVLKLFQ